MPLIPLRFEPDPEVPGADELGIGTVTFSDGSSRYSPGDPELASAAKAVMQNASHPEVAAELQKMGVSTPAQAEGFLGQSIPESPAIPEKTSGPRVGAPNADNSTGSIGEDIQGAWQALTGKAGEVPTNPSAPGMRFRSAPELPPSMQALKEKHGIAEDGSSLMSVDPGDAGVDPSSVSSQPGPNQSVQPPPADMPPSMQALMDKHGVTHDSPLDSLTPTKREGRLDPEVAARQQAEAEARDARVISATEEARRNEYEQAHSLAVQMQAQAQAREAEAKRIQAEELAKQARWRKEQSDVINSNLKTDLATEDGPLVSLLTILGTALMGYVGSDAGLRMIEKRMDRFTREQVEKKNSKLALLKDRLGSSEQAVQMAKNQYYEALKDKADAMMKNASAETFRGNTQAVTAGLEQKQAETRAASEREAMGKITEELPPQGKPPDPEMVRKYGEQVGKLEETDLALKRAARAAGADIVQDNNGRHIVANRDEVKARGIPGVGRLNAALQGDGILGKLQKLVLSGEGLESQAAAAVLQSAQARSNEPGGRLSDEDIRRASDQLGISTEDGFLDAITRLADDNAKHLDNIKKSFSPEVRAQYERNYSSSDGGMGFGGKASSRRDATLEDLNSPGGSAQNAKSAAQSPETLAALKSTAANLGVAPEAISQVIQGESGWDPSKPAKNSPKHSGLLQLGEKEFESAKIKAGMPNLTREQYLKMSAAEQMPIVEARLAIIGVKPGDDAGTIGFKNAAPGASNANPDDIIFERGSPEWDANPPWRGKDGNITRASMERYYRSRG